MIKWEQVIKEELNLPTESGRKILVLYLGNYYIAHLISMVKEPYFYVDVPALHNGFSIPSRQVERWVYLDEIINLEEEQV